MFCSNCGKEIPENGKFCSACGNQIMTETPISADDNAAPKFHVNKKKIVIAATAALLCLAIVIIIVSCMKSPEELLKEATKDAKIIIVPEMNVGKYVHEVERVLKDKKVIPMSKCGGDIHTPTEILDEILKEVGLNE